MDESQASDRDGNGGPVFFEAPCRPHSHIQSACTECSPYVIAIHAGWEEYCGDLHDVESPVSKTY